MNRTEKIQELLDEISSKVKTLNLMLDKISDDERRAANLQTRYWFGGAGSAQAGLGFKSIIPMNEEHNRGKAFQTDIDYDYYRKKLRLNHVNEPEIWIRFPAKTQAEHEEKAERMKGYLEKREKKLLIHDPFKSYCLAEAKQQAKQTGKSVDDLMSDKVFLDNCRAVWDIIL